jgi:cytochrome c oxidase subunit 4
MHPHVVPKSVYFLVAAALFVLLVVTVLAAQFDLGYWNTPLAMLIALAKAALIVLYFMHVRYGHPLLRVFAAGGFLWLLILFALMLPDYLTRQ